MSSYYIYDWLVGACAQRASNHVFALKLPLLLLAPLAIRTVEQFALFLTSGLAQLLWQLASCAHTNCEHQYCELYYVAHRLHKLCRVYNACASDNLRLKVAAYQNAPTRSSQQQVFVYCCCCC